MRIPSSHWDRLTTYACQAEDMMQISGLGSSKEVTYTINTRALRRWGLCKHNPDGSHTIEIADRLLEEGVSSEAVLNTVCHELIHTIKGCNNHGKNFKVAAAILNKKFGLNVKTRTSAEEKGIEPIEVVRPVKHQFVCEHCGQVIKRYRESDFTKRYKQYTCGRCGGHFRKEF